MLAFRHIGYWLLYPLVYLIYTLVRGAGTGWYPYPFLNPATVDGYGVVVLYCAAIFIAFLIVGWLVITVGNNLMARLVAIDDDATPRPRGLLNGKIWIADDFDAPLSEEALRSFEGRK
jgi:hypothetical protein